TRPARAPVHPGALRALPELTREALPGLEVGAHQRHRGADERVERVVRQVRTRRVRVDATQEQRFAAVDVADARHDLLVEQQLAYREVGGATCGAPAGPGPVERL